MCFDARAVNAQVLVICIRIQFLKNVQNGSVVTPLAESAVNGLMWPKPRRDIRPGCTASGQPKHSIEHHLIILWWPAGLSSWNQIFDPVPLGIGQLVSPCCLSLIHIFVTIGAATTALYTVMWRISAGQDVRVIREFWDAMRTNWKVATASWGIMLLVGLLLAGNMVALSGVQAPPALLTLMKGAAGLVLISYLIVLHYLFAGIAKYYVTISQAFKNAWLWGMASLPRTLVLFCLSAVSAVSYTHLFRTPMLKTVHISRMPLFIMRGS